MGATPRREAEARRESTRHHTGSMALLTPDLRLLGSKVEDNTFLLPKATQFVVFCHSNSRKPMQAARPPLAQPSDAFQDSWPYPRPTNEAVEGPHVSVSCLRCWLVAEQDSNPSLLIPSCYSGFPGNAFLWLPEAPSRRQGPVLKVMAPRVSHSRSSGEHVSWLWSPEGVYLSRKKSQLLTKKKRKNGWMCWALIWVYNCKLGKK